MSAPLINCTCHLFGFISTKVSGHTKLYGAELSLKYSTLNDLLVKMPKERRPKFYKAKSRKDRYKDSPASTIFFEVIGTGANGSPKSLSIFTTFQRYLFNCGEGTQRLANEHKIKLSKLEDIFITHQSWDNVGGLAGLTLTVQGMGISKFTLHGPPRVEQLLNNMRSFINTAQIKISKHEYFDPTFQDGNFRISSVPIFSTKKLNLKGIENQIEDLPHVEDQTENGGARSRSPSPTPTTSKRQKLESELEDPRDVSVAYICKTHPRPGHLLVDKCIEMEVPTGPLLGKLKNGEDVTLPDGRVIKSKDVVAPEEPQVVFIIIECPTEDFLDSLLENEKFKHYQKTSSDIPEIIVHFSPNNVINHPRYKEWMSRFPLTTRHLLINEACPGLPSAAVYRLQHKLNLVHPQVFPLLKTNFELPQNSVEDQNVTLAKPLLKYYIRPPTGFNTSNIVNLEPETYLNEVTTVEGWNEKYELFKKSLEENNVQILSDSNYPQIIFLGTGSSIPSKERNVSCILLRLSENKWMILDCGEGSYGQILRFFGSSETAQILRNLSAIFISHLHADHHIGLIKIVQERQKILASEMNLVDRPLFLLAPNRIDHWLKLYDSTFAPILDQLTLISNRDFQYDQNQVRATGVYQHLLVQLQLKDVSTVKVIHRALTFGVILTHKEGWKMVYSGDTMPCDDLVKAGKKCDLLIHEATMEDDLIEDAKNKTHSTTSQAIDVGQRMEAKFTMLTHFSQRYAKVPFFTDKFDRSVGVAFDNMIISLNDVGVTSLFKPILQVIFVQDIVDMQDRQEQRLRRKEYDEEREKEKILVAK